MTSEELHRRMYAIVCFAASRAIEIIDSGRYDEARSCLQDALDEAEDFYIDELESDLPDWCRSDAETPEGIVCLQRWWRELNAQAEEIDLL